MNVTTEKIGIWGLTDGVAVKNDNGVLRVNKYIRMLISN